MRKILFSLLGVVLAVAVASAHINPSESQAEAPNNNNKVTFRESCNAAKAQRDQAVNNVRARLLTGGDVWWDGSGDGRYVVPKVPPGVPEVSSLYAGAVWLGGVDEAGNLKVAAQTYSSRGEDFWPGPLFPEKENEDDPDPGTTDQEICSEWDAFFVVTGAEIDEHIGKFEETINSGGTYEPSSIPKGVRGWPGRGNPFFLDVNGFELPNTSQGLAGFWDEDGDGLYNPQNGDYPIIEIRGCEKPQYPDEMIFWIYNDNGNIHAQSNGDPIQMEIQVQAFGYATNDELNDMTFQRYKLINRAIEPIDSAFFAMWVDPDLGCYTDDYIGCDTLRSLAVVYNEDVLDGQTGCSCPGGVNTYCDEVPVLGIDYFRGPLGPKVFGPNGTLLNPGRGEEPDTIVELGMSSFTYFNNTSPGNWPAAMQDPGNALEYYRYLTGSWRDGSPFTYGDDAYQDGDPIRYAFTEAPDDPNGWSMCTAGLGEGDRRTIQASGPFRLDPGAVNELIIGVVWVPDQSYPCPSIRRLQEADDIAQALFDNCFDLTDGPDAPDLDIIELDRELIIVLTNDTILTVSNNAFEEYKEVGLEIPSLAQDSFYRFEGYKIYQVSGSNIGLSPENVADPSKARLIYQVDIRNGVSRVFNWNTVDAPVEEDYYVPTLMVDGGDSGIRHTFRVSEDAFASEDRRLVNHKKYYFAAVAYAFNEYEPFDPKDIIGQRKPYLEGRRNIGPNGDGLPYTAIPRPIVDRQLNADFGAGATITRIDGLGNGGNFVDLSDETRALLEEAFLKEEKSIGELTYAEGRGPLNIQVFNPLDVKDGNFELKFVDANLQDDALDQDAHWEMTLFPNDGSYRVVSEKSIAQLNEQIVRDYGFTVSIGQVSEPGAKDTKSNGYIPSEIRYRDITSEPWYGFFPEGTDLIPTVGFDDALFDYTSLNAGQIDAAIDPDGGLAQYGQSPFLPYYLLDWRSRGSSVFTGEVQFITPVWTNNSAGGIIRSQMKLENLNNVDVVFTSNKDLWSRCVVIETANRFYTDAGYPTEGNRKQFDLRAAPSVGKDTDENGLPKPDGDGNGMGWFPGYAVDVETGQRLNLFWGENSIYDGSLFPETYLETPAGRDMMFNPNGQLILGSEEFFPNLPLPYYLGGQHMVYVSRLPYDSCQIFRANFGPSPSPLTKVKAVRELTWAGMVVPLSGAKMLSYADGLIPSDVVVKLRTNSPYQVENDLDYGDYDMGDDRTGTGENNYHPLYRFSINGKEASALDQMQVNESLDMIDVVPNPYYGFSDYETSQFTNTIKITNLPAKCVVTIYTLEGKFIRQYVRDEVGTVPGGNNRALNRNQITPAIEWDLRNNKSIPVASGVYLIHVAAEGLGERTLKWFGVNREFDPSGL
ncbi:MAG: hypothetical protein H6557_25540 [Lewinellaceae bacterium]|nr:hypothetical protein [Phaeodactylibacter sp.]MCB9039999.1 hypothetical protein [Lewinellaceae bacterium]